MINEAKKEKKPKTDIIKEKANNKFINSIKQDISLSKNIQSNKDISKAPSSNVKSLNSDLNIRAKIQLFNSGKPNQVKKQIPKEKDIKKNEIEDNLNINKIISKDLTIEKKTTEKAFNKILPNKIKDFSINIFENKKMQNNTNLNTGVKKNGPIMNKEQCNQNNLDLMMKKSKTRELDSNKITQGQKGKKIIEDSSPITSLKRNFTININNFEVNTIDEQLNYQKILLDYNILDFPSKYNILFIYSDLSIG